MGGNKDAAQRLAFTSSASICLVYGYLGFIAGVASLVQAQLAQSVTPTVLVGKELDVLAAVVLGGASLTGGVGTRVRRHSRRHAARDPAERPGPARRLLLLEPMVRRPDDPLRGLDHRLVGPAPPRDQGDKLRACSDEPRDPARRATAASPAPLPHRRRSSAARARPGRRWSSSSGCCSAISSSASARCSRWRFSCRNSASCRWR